MIPYNYMNSNLITGNKRVLIAMSGGVDSSAAAFLLQKNGYECTGAMMKLFDADTEDVITSHRGCCTLSDVEDARAVSQKLAMPFYVFNFTDLFEQEVMRRFIAVYQQGFTPNPCIDCNRFIKFEKFLHRAFELEHDCIATGHYARISQREDGRWLLKKGLDATKDQSYVLYAMTQQQLARTLLPLGELKKEDVRNIAESAHLINARKRDSQDICFAPDGDYAGFITRQTHEPTAGNFINEDGQILGKHRGLIYYTIGQRKGLGISSTHPLYVTALNPAENTVTLGTNEQLFTRHLTANEINLIAYETITKPLRVTAKIRYAHVPQPATVVQTDNDTITVTFDEPQRAITPGQAVVLYDGDIVVGGGIIIPT